MSLKKLFNGKKKQLGFLKLFFCQRLDTIQSRSAKLVSFLLPEKYNKASSILSPSFYVYVLFLQGFLNADDFLSVALVSMQKQADRMDDVRAAFR